MSESEKDKMMQPASSSPTPISVAQAIKELHTAIQELLAVYAYRPKWHPGKGAQVDAGIAALIAAVSASQASPSKVGVVQLDLADFKELIVAVQTAVEHEDGLDGTVAARIFDKHAHRLIDAPGFEWLATFHQPGYASQASHGEAQKEEGSCAPDHPSGISEPDQAAPKTWPIRDEDEDHSSRFDPTDMAGTEPRLTRCRAVSPGGVTTEGQLPRQGTQCGLEDGHDGEHCVIVPTGYPWFRSGQRQRTTD